MSNREIDSHMDSIVYTDSSSAKALAQRRGVGRLKHVDLRHLWVQACIWQKLLRLKKVGTVKNVSDLNTKSLSVARRKHLVGLCGLSKDQKKISTTNQTTKINKFEMSLVHRVATILAGLPMSEAVSLHEVSNGISTWSMTLWMVAAGMVLTISILSMMMSGPSSRALSWSERSSDRQRRYRDASLSEVSDPEEWMRHHHHNFDEMDREADEGAGEPEAEVELCVADAETIRGLDRRLFLIFFVLVDAKFAQWGRRVEPQFEFELAGWTSKEAPLKTLKQLRILALCLDVGGIHQVDEMLTMLSDDTENEVIRAELTRLEERYQTEMTLTESIRWLYETYRSMMVGQQYDKVKWSAEVFGSDEEKMRVFQERALDAIQDRIDNAMIMNDQEEVHRLEALQRRIGLL